jgi:hypothetical protein
MEHKAAFDDMKKARKEQTHKNIRTAVKLLAEQNIPIHANKEDHSYIMIRSFYGFVDFWPGTTKWYDRKLKLKGLGILALMHHIKFGSEERS